MPMTPERWQEVDRLLKAALELEPAKRSEFLAAATDDDPDLRREVESLLAFHGRAGDFLAAPPAEAAADFLRRSESRSGETIGHYLLGRELGRGGMGVVYLATDTRLGRQVALKLLLDELMRDPLRVRRFRQEARAASALNHPNIITIYEVGKVAAESGGTHFIAAELVEGQTLRDLCSSRSLRLGEALDLLVQVASALDAAHRAGIVHRDIKPENIMLREDGIVKVLDFGLAKLTEEAARPEVLGSAHLTTDSGQVMGTTSYMSPEQARGLKVDARSDLFSLGVVIYELLTGNRPFTGETSSDVLVALLTSRPQPVSSLVPGLPLALQGIVDRALAKPVDERYQTARKILERLKEVKEELEFAARLGSRAGSDDDPLMMILGAQASGAQATAYSTLDAAATNIFSRDYRTSHQPLVRSLLGRRGAALMIALLAVAALVFGVFRFALRWEAPQEISRIAVLPFVNRSHDAQIDPLPDAITESMIDNLSQLPGLTVLASSTVSAFKGRSQDPRQTGRELKADAVVTGALWREGDQARLQVEMLRTEDGARLWGAGYPIPLAGMLDVQRAITREMAATLRLRLQGGEERQAASRHTENSEAYKLYMFGRAIWNKRTSEAIRAAIGYYEDALEKDPNYALAYVGLADAYATLGSYRLMRPSEALPKAREAIEKALKLDDKLPEARASMGKILTDYEWNWEAAEKEFQLAISLQPNCANAHHWYSTLLAHLGRHEEAIHEVYRAQDLDLLSPATNTQVGNILYRARRYDAAIAALQDTLRLEPDFLAAHLYLALCYAKQQRYDEAIAACEKARVLAPESPDPVSVLGMICGFAGRRDEARRNLEELKEKARRGFVTPFSFAGIYAALGDLDTAFEYVEKCFEERSPVLRGLKTDPIFDPLRSDPRFAPLLERAGFAP